MVSFPPHPIPVSERARLDGRITVARACPPTERLDLRHVPTSTSCVRALCPRYYNATLYNSSIAITTFYYSPIEVTTLIYIVLQAAMAGYEIGRVQWPVDAESTSP